jgi:hypothetical protein
VRVVAAFGWPAGFGVGRTVVVGSSEPPAVVSVGWNVRSVVAPPVVVVVAVEWVEWF